MKKYINIFYLIIALTIMASNSSFAFAKENQIEENSQKIVLEKDINFKTMTSKEKTYKSLDSIKSSPQLTKKVSDFSNVLTMEDDKAFDELLELSKEEPQILYVGYDECPYCRAFIPKLNQMAKSYDKTVHYYNVHEHSADKNFSEIINSHLKIEVVPHAFIVRDGKVTREIIDSESTMKTMEEFVISLDKE